MKKYNKERGASLVEYSMLVAFGAVLAMSAVSAFGQQVSSKYEQNALQIELIGVTTNDVGCGERFKHNICE